MNHWLPRDVTTMPLGSIDAEISALEKEPSRDRSVADTWRLSDLRDARRRITGSGRGYG